jgi:hypothetical protein
MVVISLLIFSEANLFAQQTTPAPASRADLQPKKKKTKRRKKAISNPAEFEGAGALQFEFGYDSNFRSRDLLIDQSGSFSLQFSATDRLQLSADMDGVASQTDRLKATSTGIGDIRLGAQLVAWAEKKNQPAFSFSYIIKLPTASAAKALGSGRYDHKFALLFSKTLSGTAVDFNVAYLNNGDEASARRISGVQSALSFSHGFKKRLEWQAELGGQSIDDDQPRGIFALSGISYQLKPRVSFDAGMRFGINPSAPRFGIYGGVAFGLTNLYKHKR